MWGEEEWSRLGSLYKTKEKNISLLQYPGETQSQPKYERKRRNGKKETHLRGS